MRSDRRMKIPMLDLKAQLETIRGPVYEAMERVVEAQWFIMGPEVAGLESEVAELTGVRHGIGVSSGTDALLAALMALDVGSGDEVVTTPYSFFATAGVISRLGATPVFVDIDPVTFNLDTEAALDRTSSRTKAIIPVHLYGRADDLDDLIAGAGKRGVPVVEDAAQAIGAKDPRGRVAGSVGRMACFSFFPSKNLGGFGDGGMIVTDDEALADQLRILRVHGSEPKYWHHVVGGNFRLDALQAAVLRVKLGYLEGWTRGRRANAERYRRLLAEAGLDGIVTSPEDTPGHIYNQFVVRAPDRDRLRSALLEWGVSTEIYYPVPLHLQPCFAYLKYREGELPVAEAAARETLALPVYPELSDNQAEYMVEGIRRFYDAEGADS